LAIAIEGGEPVSGLLLAPAAARACYVLAHGAGAGMTHPFLAAMAEALFARDIATLRFQFPSMERGSKRPDPPRLAHAAVRAAVAEATRQVPGLPLFAGGKSFGGRMTSQAQAASPLPHVRGLAFLGFPLHPAGKPALERAAHLADVNVPMLWLQGTRDALADPALLSSVCAGLGARATLTSIADADHAFHVPASTGRRDADIRAELAGKLADWIDRVVRAKLAYGAG
jgi:predicted alpha/beta-hydrolase family hydrolase